MRTKKATKPRAFDNAAFERNLAKPVLAKKL